MSHNAFYSNGLGGFPPIDAPSPLFGVPASRAPHSIQDGMSSFNATGLTENDNGHVEPSPPRPPVVPPLGPDNTNRKQLDLAPVVGSVIQYSNKHLPYRPIPEEIEQVRSKLFHLEQDALLDSQQISDYWPHMTNVWIRSTKPSSEDNGVVTEIYECRNRRRMERKGTDRGGTGVRQRKNKDNMLEDMETCKLRVRVQSYTKHAEGLDEPCRIGFMDCKCIPEWAYITRTQLTKERHYKHEHDLLMLDRYKRSDAILYFAKLKVEEHYSYAAVTKWLIEKYGQITPQVNCISKQDIANASRFWRALNRDVELRLQVDDETDLERQRKDCFRLIGATSAGQLSKALIEVCRRTPEAVDIILPFLEKADSPEPQFKPIKEGADIVIPPPGCPVAKQYDTLGTYTNRSSNYKGTYLTPEQVAARLQEQRNELPVQPAAPQTMTQPPSAVPYEPRSNVVPAPLPLRNPLHPTLAPQQFGQGRPGQSAVATTARTAYPSAPGNSSNVRINASMPGVPMPHYQAEQPTPPRAPLVSQPFPGVSHSTTNASNAGPSVCSATSARPSWAVPAVKRPIDATAEKLEPKRQAMDDITAQLQNELK